jgi:perosamine synthetase
MNDDRIPLHRPAVGEEEIAAVTEVLRSGWLTTGEHCRRFEAEAAAFVGTKHAVAVNSCTAALHLALEAVGVGPGDLVLVPTFTFAATAEVVIHLGATPVLIDSERDTLNLDVGAAERTLDDLAAGRPVPGVRTPGRVRAIIPVHYAGQMADVDGANRIARAHGLRVIEDAAHALPAFARGSDGDWRACGTTSEQTCFSFYANKTITTGEGGLLATDSEELAARARSMSLHGLSADAWNRFGSRGSWRYQITAAGYKYNLTDLAAALGRVQLGRAEALWKARARLAQRYRTLLESVEEVELPTEREDRRSSWHLYPIRLRLDRLTVDRGQIIDELSRQRIGTSVHWMPLHLHPYYRERFGFAGSDFPVAEREWERLISLPLYPTMTGADLERVAATLREVVTRHRRRAVA